MGKIIFILGGARSGKSAFALKMAEESAGRVAFIATCEPKDCEMKKRIAAHKRNRTARWKTFEEPLNPVSIIKKIGSQFDCILIDCLTLLISNMMMKGFSQTAIENKINRLLRLLNKIKAGLVIVSNEVGLGIVPDNKEAREFRDIAGRVNQIVARKSDEVFFLVSGVPWRIK